MNYTSNDTCSMLHMNTDASALQDYSKISVYHQDTASSSADPLCAMMQSMALNGDSVLRIAEDTIEVLQEQFILYVQQKLEEHKISLQEKLNISLSANNTLIIECADENEDILSALGEDENIITMFIQLQRYAYIINGVHMLQAGSQSASSSMVPARYNMCLKGALSHFYLK